MPLATIRQARTGKALFWRCVQEAWGPLAAEVPGMHQQIMPAGVAPCAGQLADMTRDMRPAMDAGNNDRLASIPNKKQPRVFGEDIMKHSLLGLLLLTGPSAFAQHAVPTIGFDSIPNPLRLPLNLYFGEVSGVSVNSKGHVFVLSRGNTTGPAYAAAATQLLEFDAKGAFVREIGKNLYAWSFGHTVKVDPAGRVVMVFGRKQEASDEETGPVKHPKPPLPAEDGRFRQVTDVAWDKAGNTFISDGYINSRIAKVDKDGNWLKSWGDRGKEPGQFNTPHSIATDANGNVYVADRGNHRIQVFDGDGKFLRQFTIDVPVPPGARPAIGRMPDEAMMAGGTFAPGSPWSLCITPPPNQVLDSSDAWPGRIYKLSLEGKVLGMLGQSGKQLKQFGWIHAMACPSQNVIYAAELLNWRVQKLILKP